MLPLSTSNNEITTYDFDNGEKEVTKEVIIQSEKIGWLHAELTHENGEKPEGNFNIVIRDALGRERHRIENCSNRTGRYGVYANIPTSIGEKLSISLENVQGIKKAQLFVN